MSDNTLIADLIRSGLDPDLVQRVTSALIEAKSTAQATVVRDESAFRSANAERCARYRANKKHVEPCQTMSKACHDMGTTCTPAPSSSPSLPPSSPSPVPPTSPPTHTPPPAPPPTREGLFADGEVSGDKPKTKESSTLPTTLTAQRIAKMFHRKLTTPWSKKEIKAFKALGHIAEEDLAAVEAHYAANWPPNRDANCLRHDLGTFLNNFRGEVDRARSAQQKQQPAPVGQGGGFLAGTGFEQR